MSETEKTTQEQILAAAKAEFLAKGFQAASLRQIVKNAGVTTGAFYGYFSSKEAVYAALVEPHAAAVMGRLPLSLMCTETVAPLTVMLSTFGSLSSGFLVAVVWNSYVPL